jgi:outer membrane receptor protein involved in Fe transport
VLHILLSFVFLYFLACGGRLSREAKALVEELHMNFTSVDSGMAGADVFLRGVGAIVVQNVEPGVGFYLDDVFVGSPRAFNLDLLDVGRAEILRGPQGTLYGRNTLGGAIHVLSIQPEETPGATLDTEFGNYAFRKVRASVNVPLVKETLFSLVRVTTPLLGHCSDNGWR